MVEKSLIEKLQRIFDFKKSTYNAPDPEEIEQETLFIRIESTTPSIKEGKEIYKVVGQAFMVAPRARYAVGYFAKRIEQADNADTKDLFFYEMEENLPVYMNLVRRGFSFVYFFSGDYDPDHGTITSIEYTEGAP